MPIITVSLFTAAKGALFLSKTGAAKMLLIKLGTLVSSGASVTTVASSGLLACTAAGYYVTVRNMSKRVVEGYSKVANGLANGNFTDFTDGLYQLARSGMTATSILHDFDTFVDGMDVVLNVKRNRESFPVIDNNPPVVEPTPVTTPVVEEEPAPVTTPTVTKINGPRTRARVAIAQDWKNQRLDNGVAEQLQLNDTSTVDEVLDKLLSQSKYNNIDKSKLDRTALLNDLKNYNPSVFNKADGVVWANANWSRLDFPSDLSRYLTT